MALQDFQVAGPPAGEKKHDRHLSPTRESDICLTKSSIKIAVESISSKGLVISPKVAEDPYPFDIGDLWIMKRWPPT